MLCNHEAIPYPSSMSRRMVSLALGTACAIVAAWLVGSTNTLAATALPSPEQFTGFRVGADNKLVRWDRIAEYMALAAGRSDRVRLRDLGRTTGGNPFLALEISAADTIKDLDRYKQLERRLYFQQGAPTPAERDEIFRRGKVVVLVTCGVHANEVGPSQMTLELVHHLATDDSPRTKQILDNVILLLVPSLNPDGQMLVTDWFNRNLGTPYDGSPLPGLTHPYAGHDNNRDMYMFTQKESQFVATLAWHDWFPAIWLDEHQMGNTGPRIFVMPAGDPINPNVHPLVYRWNGILGQAQAAALDAEGKTGIISNWTYTNFWEGAMAWAGWWHNQMGLLTEVAEARTASPVEQRRASAGAADPPSIGTPPDTQFDAAFAPAPTDITPRSDYLRPWLGGRWTLRDVVEYDLISTLGLLDTAASLRETLLRQVYEVNRQTVESGPAPGRPAVVVPRTGQQDAREVAHLVERLRIAGVEVYTADEAFQADGHAYEAGTFVIPMTQVFGRYAKDVLETQAYPDLRRQGGGPEPPYDVTGWSLGLLLGVHVDFLATPLPAALKRTRVTTAPVMAGVVPPEVGRSDRGAFTFAYTGPDTAIAINRLLARGARVGVESPSRVVVAGVDAREMAALAASTGLSLTAAEPGSAAGSDALTFRAPRIALYAPWTGGNPDEGWTRFVLEQYGFTPTVVHNADLQAGGLRTKFDALILPDQRPSEMIDGFDLATIRPEFRGGIGEAGLQNLVRFVTDGGTLVALGLASDVVIDRFRLTNVRNEKRNIRRDQHFAPGSLLRLDVDTMNPLAYGMAREAVGFYDNSPFFAVTTATNTPPATVVARFPAERVLASGWLRGESYIAGRAAVVSVPSGAGRIVLFGIRPQHRAQTHATFPLLFNALYLSAAEGTGQGVGR